MPASTSPSAPRQGSWAAAVSLLAATVPAVVGLGTKVAKLLLLKAPFSQAVAALAVDMGFAGLWPLAWWGLARLTRPRWLRALLGLLATLASVALLVFFVVDMGFFLKTGTVVDGFMLRYGWQQRHELWQVLRSELDPVSTAALLLGPLLPALPAVTGLLRSLRERLRALDAGLANAPAYLGLAAAALGLLAMAAQRPAETDELASLRASPLTALAQAVTGADPSDEGEGTHVDPSAYAPRRLVPKADRPDRPLNVVLVVLESTRAQSTSLHDSKLETTPFLVELARRGRWAERMYTTVPHTSKALVSILCGVTPWLRTPIMEAQLGRIPVDCLPGLLRGQGYATAFFQTATAGFENRTVLVQNAGFEEFYERDDMPPGFHHSSYFGFEDRAMLGPVRSWVRRHREQPFLLTVLTLATHHNYVVPRGFRSRRYVDDPTLNRYLNILRYQDQFVRNLYETLEREGLAERTVFLVVGDHGEGFGEHGRYQHDNTIYEEGLHVPLVLAGPGVGPAGTPIEGLRQHQDILPTVADLLGYHVRGGRLEGRSLLSPSWRSFVRTSCWYERYCMARVEDRLKFIYHYHRRPPEVFDLRSDPLERHDLRAAGSADPLRLNAAMQELKRWRGAVNAWWKQAPVRGDNPWIGTEPTRPKRAADIVFGNAIRLRGVDGPEPPLGGSRRADLRYHFEVLEDPPTGTKLFVHLVNARGDLVRNLDHVPVQGTYPVDAWERGQFVVDPHRISLPYRMPPGRYRVVLGFWNARSKERLEPRGEGLPVDARRRFVEITGFQVPARRPVPTRPALPSAGQR